MDQQKELYIRIKWPKFQNFLLQRDLASKNIDASILFKLKPVSYESINALDCGDSNIKRYDQWLYLQGLHGSKKTFAKQIFNFFKNITI